MKATNKDGAKEVNEDEENGDRYLENTMGCESMKNKTHGVLTDSEIEVASGGVHVEASTNMSASFHVLSGRFLQTSGSRDVRWDCLGKFLFG